jgi:hypothetical protein
MRQLRPDSERATLTVRSLDLVDMDDLGFEKGMWWVAAALIAAGVIIGGTAVALIFSHF